MNLPRLWRTVRHLSAGQWLHRGLCRGRRAAMLAFPGASRQRIAHAAARLPLPDPSSPRLAAVARPVLRLQTAIHGDDPGGVAKGRFMLLNRIFDFGGIEKIAWRGDFEEGGNPLRRMTLSYMGYAVPLLAHGRAGDLDTVLRLLRGFEAGTPWSEPGVLDDVWNPYAASHRLINLLSGLSLYRATGAPPDPASEDEILRHARFCAAFVRSSLERDLQYNHLFKNLVALAAYAGALPDLPAALRFLPAALARALRQNVLEDGGHAERSPMYHLLSLLDVDIVQASGLLSGDTAALASACRARMAAALTAMSHPDGDIALFNDAWLGEAPAARDLAGPAAVAETARLPETGYVRLGRGGDAVLFDCGPCGPDDNPGHAHADFLSVEASVGGARLIVDPGVPTYTAGAERDVCRSAAVHNGPHLKGVEPVEFWKSFRVGRRGRAAEITDKALAEFAPLWCAGRQDGYAHVGVEVRRFVGLWPGAGLLIADLWLGSKRHDAATSFLIPAGWSRDGGQDARFVRDGTRVHVSALAGRLDDVRPDRHCLRFGLAAPAHRVTLQPEARGPCGALATWLCWSDAPPPDGAALTGLFDRLAGSRPRRKRGRE